MNCPLCKTPLTRIEYESFYLHRCGECHGHLVAQQRLEVIQRRRDKSIEELKQEVETNLQTDTDAKLRCPRCKGAMRKGTVRGDLFQIDACAACKLVWFDGGELALLQLHHQNSPQGRDQAEFQRRLEAMTDEQKAEYERNLAKMQPGFGPTPEEVLWEVLMKHGPSPLDIASWFT